MTYINNLSPVNGNLAIETRGLTKQFGAHLAVNQLNLQVPTGAVYGFLGRNGAGKSTTIRILMGMLGPTNGTATVLGHDPVRDSISVKQRVGYVPDTPMFYEWMTMEETMSFCAHYRRGTWGPGRAEDLVRSFEIPLGRPMSTMSKGQRAKASLVLALAFNPDVLILDEPTLGLDPAARRQFVEGVLAEFCDSGRTILISSHLISEIAGIIDHVGIMDNGRLVSQETTESLLGRVRQLNMEFDGPAPASAMLPGLLHYKPAGRHAMAIVSPFDAGIHDAVIRATGASGYTTTEVPMEEVFIYLTNHGRQQL